MDNLKPYELAFVQPEYFGADWLKRAVSVLMAERYSFKFDMRPKTLDGRTGYMLLVYCVHDNDFAYIVDRCRE